MAFESWASPRDPSQVHFIFCQMFALVFFALVFFSFFRSCLLALVFLRSCFSSLSSSSLCSKKDLSLISIFRHRRRSYWASVRWTAGGRHQPTVHSQSGATRKVRTPMKRKKEQTKQNTTPPLVFVCMNPLQKVWHDEGYW